MNRNTTRRLMNFVAFRKNKTQKFVLILLGVIELAYLGMSTYYFALSSLYSDTLMIIY